MLLTTEQVSTLRTIADRLQTVSDRVGTIATDHEGMATQDVDGFAQSLVSILSQFYGLLRQIGVRVTHSVDQPAHEDVRNALQILHNARLPREASIGTPRYIDLDTTETSDVLRLLTAALVKLER